MRRTDTQTYVHKGSLYEVDHVGNPPLFLRVVVNDSTEPFLFYFLYFYSHVTRPEYHNGVARIINVVNLCSDNKPMGKDHVMHAVGKDYKAHTVC